MLMIRLQRVGKKHDPSFRVVLTDSKNGARSGKFTEILGSYNARGGKAELKKDRIKYWLSVGAKTSVTLHNLLVSHKIIEGKKLNALPKITRAKRAAMEAEKTKAEEAAKAAEESAKAEAEKEEAPVESTEPTEEKKEEAAPVETTPEEPKAEEATPVEEAPAEETEEVKAE